MKILLGILFFVFGFLSLVLTFSIDYDKDLKNKIIAWISTLCAGLCFGSALNYFGVFDAPKTYPAENYTISIKTTTIDNKTDTTYVIKRKNK